MFSNSLHLLHFFVVVIVDNYISYSVGLLIASLIISFMVQICSHNFDHTLENIQNMNTMLGLCERKCFDLMSCLHAFRYESKPCIGPTACHVLWTSILVFNQLLWTEYKSRGNISRIAAFHFCWRFYRYVNILLCTLYKWIAYCVSEYKWLLIGEGSKISNIKQ